MSYKEYITEVPDFPKDGISFKDISPLLADEQTFRSAIVEMGGVYYNDVGIPVSYTHLTLPTNREV